MSKFLTSTSPIRQIIICNLLTTIYSPNGKSQAFSAWLFYLLGSNAISARKHAHAANVCAIALCAAGLRVLLIGTGVTARAVLSNATKRKLSSFAHLAKGDEGDIKREQGGMRVIIPHSPSLREYFNKTISKSFFL